MPKQKQTQYHNIQICSYQIWTEMAHQTSIHLQDLDINTLNTLKYVNVIKIPYIRYN